MKHIVFLALITMSLTAEIWRDDFINGSGFNKEIICKHGYLISVITKKDNGIMKRIEQQYCYDISAWDGNCNHPPVKCEEKKK
jgi:hypothetical protein